jgi:hypothetical protein
MPSPKRRMGAFNALNDLPSVDQLPLTESEPETETAHLWPWLESRTPAPPHPVAVHRMNPRPRRIGGFNALDDLLPGPPLGQGDGIDDLGDGGWAAQPVEPPPVDAPPRRPRRGAPEARASQRPAGYNALDDLLPGPGGYAVSYGQGRLGGGYQSPPRREKVRMTFLLPEDLIEEAEDAAAFLAGPPTRLTMRLLAEQALRNEVDRLADVYHGGRPFPRRQPRG